MSQDKIASDCIEFKGCLDCNGYGTINVKGVTLFAHRLSFRIFNSKIPNDRMVCHSCDNPACINPKHLFLGTQKENIQDAAAKLRMTQKLTKEKVIEIRDRYASGESSRKLGKEFNVGHSMILAIKNRRCWNHV